jgi:hypothetical protein
VGVKYSSSESEALIQALTNNSNIATQIVERLTNGCKHLIAVLNTGLLSGAVYTAGKGLIEQIIIPAIYKVHAAIDDVRNDLSSYSYADSQISGYDLLDEDNLRQQLTLKNAQVDEINDQLERNNNFFNLIQETFSGELGAIIAQNQALEYMRDQILEPQISEIKTKLDKLQWFVSAVSSLFSDSLEAFQLAIQGAIALNQVSFDSSGNYYINNADMSWTKKLGNEKFDEGAGGLTIKYKKDPKDLKAIMEMAKSMGLSPLKAEDLYLALKKYSENQKRMDKLNRLSNFLNGEYSTKDDHDEYKEKLKKYGEASAFQWNTALGKVEFGKAVTEKKSDGWKF